MNLSTNTAEVINNVAQTGMTSADKIVLGTGIIAGVILVSMLIWALTR